MDCTPADARFRRDWRAYQFRVLRDLDRHLGDNRLHVVAAPGSGKTILGLEIIRRVNRPVLVLAPTITIRDQWVQRFVEMFLPTRSVPPWVSFDIRQPKWLTVATYQALHTACNSSSREPEDILELDEAADAAGSAASAQSSAEERRQFIEDLRAANIGAFVVDECHHLRAEWWKTLSQVIGEFQQAKVIALTATPPYDVQPLEWERYERLCGPVDAEISVPELVATGDLCPHQDYVHITAPTDEEHRQIVAFRKNIQRLFDDITVDAAFIAALENHPWVTSPQTHIEEILEDPEYVSAICIFLRHAGRPVPRPVVEALGVTGERLPPLDLEWLETLLTACIYSDRENYSAHEGTMHGIEQRLRACGGLEHRRVTLRTSSETSRLLTASLNKFNSILEIVRMERESLGDALRAVILTDYIRKNDLPRNAGELRPLTQVGVVPIFESLRRAAIPGVRVGILSGSLVVVPVSALQALQEAAAEFGWRADAVSITRLEGDPSFARVEVAGEHSRSMVRLMTRLFSDGIITLIVGTKSLLGEGWDAPSLNCLILASSVGSYMLSNQMRGRAIRTDARDPGKTANIWHLVCVDPYFGAGADYEALERRFRAFVGVSFKERVIENGFARLDMGEPPFGTARIAEVNARMMQRAHDRGALRAAWREALAGGVRQVEALQVPKARTVQNFVWFNTLKALCYQGFFGAIYIFGKVMESLRWRSAEQFWTVLKIAVAAGALVGLPFLLRAGWLFLRHGTLESSVQRVGEALLQSLRYSGAVQTPAKQLRVETHKGEAGRIDCWLAGATPYEQSVFLDALRDLLEPVQNPRYLLLRKSRWLPWFREDYNAVPDSIGRKKENAEHFLGSWKKYVGPAELIFTRSLEGRQLLLRARVKSYAAAFQLRLERRSCWK